MEPRQSFFSTEVESNTRIGEYHFLMKVRVAESFRQAIPGQFIMLRITGKEIPFLGRPLGIYSLYPEGDGWMLELLYQVVGKGTAEIAGLQKGNSVDIWGPLGNGFDKPSNCKVVLCVAGGFGIVPLSFLVERYNEYFTSQGIKVVFYLGGRSREYLIGTDKLKRLPAELRICTDDGSAGHHGLVPDLLAGDINMYSPEDVVVYACGPLPMLKRVAEMARSGGWRCQVTMEERMACGVGACLGCAVKVKHTESELPYKTICKHGPVFDVREIEW